MSQVTQPAPLWRGHTSTSAFTLIEVLLVVLIIGILAATGFSSIGKFAESASAGSARDTIIGMMNRVKSYALNGRATDWCTAAGGTVIAGEEENRKVPESYGIKIILSENPQKIQLFAADSKNPPSPCIIEEKNLFEKAGMTAGIGEDKLLTDQEFFYSAPFGDFSMTNPPIDNKIIINIYPPDESAPPLRTVTINKNIGIPE